MLQIIKANCVEGVFQPEELVILVAAFLEAWEHLKGSGVHFASDNQVQQARNKLGKYIIDQAKKGERDKAVLRDGALLAYGLCLQTATQQLIPRANGVQTAQLWSACAEATCCTRTRESRGSRRRCRESYRMIQAITVVTAMRTTATTAMATSVSACMCVLSV